MRFCVSSSEVLAYLESIALVVLSFVVNSGVIVTIAFFGAVATRHYLLPPVAYVELPLNFVFDTCTTTLSDICSFPTANVSLRFPTADDEDDEQTVVVYNVPYQLSLVLNLLVRDPNQVQPLSHIGVFMSVMRAFTAEDHLVSTFARSRTLRPVRTTWFAFIIRTVKCVTFWPLWLIGYFDGDRDIRSFTLLLAEKFYDSPVNPTQYLSVQLQNRHFEILSATLRIQAQLDYVTSFLFHWPIVSTALLFVVFAMMFWFFSAVYWVQRIVVWICWAENRQLKNVEQMNLRTATSTAEKRKKLN